MKSVLSWIMVVSVLGAGVPAQAQVEGDTFDNPFELFFEAVPYMIIRTTAGYADDYALECLAGPSDAPDVVYAFTPAESHFYRFDTCPSNFAAALYVFDQNQELLACNLVGNTADPECGNDAVIEGIFVAAGTLVFVVIDGQDGAAGTYQLRIDYDTALDVDCPAGGFAETERPTTEGGSEINCGCACAGDPLWEPLHCNASGESWLCLMNGWRADGDGDEDWLWGTVGPSGDVHLELTCRYGVQAAVWTNPDCMAADPVVANLWLQDRGSGSMDFSATPGSDFIVRITRTFLLPPLGVYPAAGEVIVHATGLDVPTGTVPVRWGAAKAMFH